MKVSIRQKLEKSEERCEEVGRMLADPQVLERADQFRELSVEYARLLPTATALREYRQLEAELESAEALRSRCRPGDARPGRGGGRRACAPRWRRSSEALQRLLLPQDPHDEGNIFLEIRAGTGGDEAAIFAGDLLRMYSRYAETPRLAGRIDQREQRRTWRAIARSSAAWSAAAPFPG